MWKDDHTPKKNGGYMDWAIILWESVTEASKKKLVNVSVRIKISVLIITKLKEYSFTCAKRICYRDGVDLELTWLYHVLSK